MTQPTTRFFVWAAVAVAVGLVALVASRSRWLSSLPIARIVLVLAATSSFTAASYWLWYVLRPLPAPLEDTLWTGVRYVRAPSPAPRPVVAHALFVDLDAPGVELFVTPRLERGRSGTDRSERGASGPSEARSAEVLEHDVRQTLALRTSEALERFDLQVAVNANFFAPFHSNWLFNNYPRSGDPVDCVGFAAAEGVAYARAEPGMSTLAIDASGRVWIETSTGAASRGASLSAAVSGYALLRSGRAAEPWPSALWPESPEPRVAVGVDRTGRTIIVNVIDGRQPGYSEGVTVAELAAISIEHGAWDAIALDGGGSATMVTDDDGDARFLNVPVHARHPPGMERPTCNHLGVRARPVP